MSVHDSNKMNNDAPPFALKVVHFLRLFTIRVPSICKLNDTNPASPPFFFYRQFWNDCIKLDPLTDDKNENALIKIANIELVIEFFSFKKNVSPSGLLLEL